MSRRCWASAHSSTSRLADSSAIVRSCAARSSAVSSASVACWASSSTSSTSAGPNSRGAVE